MQNTHIKKKQLEFQDDKQNTYHLKIVYDTSNFGDGDKSFWKTQLYQVNDERLIPPIEYQYIQHRGWVMQNPKFREHSFDCTSRRKEIEGKTNLYQIAKQQAIYQYTNRKAILKYESKVNNFKFFVGLKYRDKLEALRLQKKQLKFKLKSDLIDNREYQKLYTPIRKSKEAIEFHIWDICYRFRDRYFSCDRLKKIYR